MKYAIAVGTMLLVGCAQNPPVAEEPFFLESSESSVTTILNAQAARGARADATLYRHHFDGAELNALGRAKLSLMMRDNSTTFPMTVYLDMAGESLVGGRSDAVREYLVAAGLTASQVKTELGPNPGTLRPAGPQIKRLNAMEDERTRGEKEQADVAAIVAPLVGEKK